MDEGRASGGGRLTTMIPRPTQRRASDAGRSRVGDVRRRRIRVPMPRLRTSWLVGLAALVIAGAIAAALFGLPARTWFDQEDDLSALEHELNELEDITNDLGNEVDRLQTDEGIREAVREELGHVTQGDNRQTMLELPALPQDLPAGWPYGQVSAILAVRDSMAASGENVGTGAPSSVTAVPATALTATTAPVSPTTATPMSAPPSTAAAPSTAPAVAAAVTTVAGVTTSSTP